MADEIEPQSEIQEKVENEEAEKKEGSEKVEEEEKVDLEQTEVGGEELGLEEQEPQQDQQLDQLEQRSVKGEELIGEGEGEFRGEEEEVQEEQKQEDEEMVEEEGYVEEPPPDPAAPLDLSDSKEAMKGAYELRPDQLAEVEKIWDLYQDYTPAYTDISGYITEKELVYMMKSLLVMTYTEEQLQELIVFCVRPPDPKGRITYDQFLKMVMIRQRDFPVEEELRAALQVLDPDKTGEIEREYLKDVLSNLGSKMPAKLLDNLIKEVDMSNDGQIGIEDVVGTMGIDLNRDDIMLLMNSLNPDDAPPPDDDM